MLRRVLGGLRILLLDEIALVSALIATLAFSLTDDATSKSTSFSLPVISSLRFLLLLRPKKYLLLEEVTDSLATLTASMSPTTPEDCKKRQKKNMENKLCHMHEKIGTLNAIFIQELLQTTSWCEDWLTFNVWRQVIPKKPFFRFLNTPDKCSPLC